MHDETAIAHLFDDPQNQHGAVNPPVYHASLFAFPDYETWKAHVAGEQLRPYVYHRASNPTVEVLERKIAHLEHAADCVATASGMAAINLVFSAFLRTGDHVLCVDTIYAPTRVALTGLYRRFGVETTFFPAEDARDLRPYLRDNTRLIFLESPTSGLFEIVDLRAVAALARERGIWTAIDNTWATPLYQRPLDLGLDISLHSGTKYISGHSDLLLGLVAGTAEAMRHVRKVYTLLGASLAPDDAYLALRGLRSLPVRLKQHETAALRIARWLQNHPEVEEVLHPGLETHPGHAVHRSQCSGDSGLFSVRLKPRDEAARAAFVNSLRLFHLGYSWGGFESLISPLAFSYYGNHELRRQLGLTDDHYRLSIGLENPDDLIQDLAQALDVYRQVGGAA